MVDEKEFEVVIEDEVKETKPLTIPTQLEIEPLEEEPEGLSDEDKKLLGKRAQRRIKGLLEKNKEVEDKYLRAVQELEQIKNEKETAAQNLVTNEAQAVKDHEEKLGSLSLQIQDTLKKAIETGDADAQIKAIDSLAQVKAEQQVLGTYKRRIQNVEQQKPKQKLVEQPRVNLPPSKKALNWAKNNEWMMGSTPRERLMQQYALNISEDIISEGVNPDSDEYFESIDAQMKTEFPAQFKEQPRKQTGVMGGTNKAAPLYKVVDGKRIVTLTASEKVKADRLGVSYKDYAIEKMKLEGQI